MSAKVQPPHSNPQKIHKTYEKYKNVPKEVLQVAEGMESQFINHMINEMRKTVKSQEPQGQATKFYNSMMDQEYAKIMSETQNGVGLKEMIIEQLAPNTQQNSVKNLQGLKTYQKQEVDSTKGGSHE